jgi:hypothetical protein
MIDIIIWMITGYFVILVVGGYVWYWADVWKSGIIKKYCSPCRPYFAIPTSYEKTYIVNRQRIAVSYDAHKGFEGKAREYAMRHLTYEIGKFIIGVSKLTETVNHAKESFDEYSGAIIEAEVAFIDNREN